ncbi:unnamed protein product [Acanthoscelides obtectus]|uniref:Uncharacterized protein n=1 Tax=Acanthoscelides obtectus TaxID=200917 RepID=A0A9P0K4A0_ACAOB|nr:unnamed protein product [Acanthoscelides obtectus]CAK1648011.1 hypothetical protein AOBTE_LOCUS15500 [Acanthoscelides obtectus]
MLQKHEDFTLTDSLIDTCLIQRLSNESISGYEKLVVLIKIWADVSVVFYTHMK